MEIKKIDVSLADFSGGIGSLEWDPYGSCEAWVWHYKCGYIDDPDDPMGFQSYWDKNGGFVASLMV